MPRLTPIRSPADAPGDTEVADLFATLFPGRDDPAFDANHDGMAIAAHSPAMALLLSQTSRHLALDLPWSGRTDLRELAIIAVSLALGSRYSAAARRGGARAAGLSDGQFEAIGEWRDSDLFDEDQRLVLAYARAVATNSVDDALRMRAVAAFGERGTVELSAVAAFWAFWALFLNATREED